LGTFLGPTLQTPKKVRQTFSNAAETFSSIHQSACKLETSPGKLETLHRKHQNSEIFEIEIPFEKDFLLCTDVTESFQMPKKVSETL